MSTELTVPGLGPLKDICLDSSLDGSAGSNRLAQELCQITAHHDLQAVQSWLKKYAARTTTHRAYQKETERLLLWCIHQRKKPLSSLKSEDFEAYFSFLDDPQPKHVWCAQPGGKGRKRGDLNWKPFVGPLGTAAKNTAISIIFSLMNYLLVARYIGFNPLQLMRNQKGRQHAVEESKIRVLERMLELDEWQTLLTTLEERPETTPHEKDEKARIKYLFFILYFLGLRINELETHTWNAFRRVQGQWWFFVVGKGGKMGKIPVNQSLLEATQLYRAHLGLTVYPEATEMMPIIPSWHSSKPLSARQMSKLIKAIAMEASLKFSMNPEKQEKLRKFSPHWLRHFSASQQDRAGVQFKHIKANHRHASDETTRRYIHSMDEARHQDMEKLSLMIKESSMT